MTEPVNPATGSMYCGVDDVKNYLKSINLTEISEGDPEIEMIIKDWSEEIEARTHRKFYRVAATERYDGNGGSQLALKGTPIISVSEVKIYDYQQGLIRDIKSTDSNFSTQLFIDLEAGVISLPGNATAAFSVPITVPSSTLPPLTSIYSNDYDYINRFGRGTQNIAVTYVYGCTDLPSPIRRACIKLVAAELLEKRGAADSQGVSTEAVAGASLSWNPYPHGNLIASLRKEASIILRNHTKALVDVI